MNITLEEIQKAELDARFKAVLAKVLIMTAALGMLTGAILYYEFGFRIYIF